MAAVAFDVPEAGIARITLHRPEVLNAIDGARLDGFDAGLGIVGGGIEAEYAADLIHIDLAVGTAHDFMRHIKIVQHRRECGGLAALGGEAKNLATAIVPPAYVCDQKVLAAGQGQQHAR